MSLQQLDDLFGTIKQAIDNGLPIDSLPIALDESSIKALFSQSMVLGVDETVRLVTKSETWKASAPQLRSIISDVQNNQEVAARFFNLAEDLFPSFISSIVKSNKKKTHVQGVVTKLIQEIRNASAN